MDEIGKLIFNALASKGALWLPGVGTFRADTIPAAENADGSLTPPRNVPVFASERADDAAAVTDRMNHQPGGELPADRYERWLAKAGERGAVVIEGIGVVNNGVFTPYESLLNSLNPIGAKEKAVVKPAAKKGALSRAEKRWIAFGVLCILVLAGGWSWWHFNNGTPTGPKWWNARNAAVTDNMDRIPEHTGVVEGTVEGEDSGEPLPDTTDQGTVETAPSDRQPSASVQSGAAAPGFYVVGNVFSVPENADRYIDRMQKKYPDLDYRKHPFKGKTLVSLYHSEERAEANRQRRRIEDRILEFDLWLYEVE